MLRRLTRKYDYHDRNGVLYGRFPRVYGGHDVLGVRLAFGALAERHGRVARLPQQQVVLEERGHGQRHGIQDRHGFQETPHGGLVCRSSCAAVAERVTLPARVTRCTCSVAAAVPLRPLE